MQQASSLQQEKQKNQAYTQIAERIIKWLNLKEYQQRFGCVIEEMDFSIACQYTKNQVVRPARSESCDISCLVERSAIEQTLTCSCGKDIDYENDFMEDYQLRDIIEYIRKTYGPKAKMIRVNLLKKEFWPV